MGWKIHRHEQPSGRVIHKLAFYHKRTKTLHIFKGRKYELKLSQSLDRQKRDRGICHSPSYMNYAITQQLPPDLANLGITTVIYAESPIKAIKLYKRTLSYIQHTMYLPDGRVIAPPPLCYAKVRTCTNEPTSTWKPLNKSIKE